MFECFLGIFVCMEMLMIVTFILQKIKIATLSWMLILFVFVIVPVLGGLLGMAMFAVMQAIPWTS